MPLGFILHQATGKQFEIGTRWAARMVVAFERTLLSSVRGLRLGWMVLGADPVRIL